MLKEVLFSSIDTERKPRPGRDPGISCSSLFPCPYRLWLVENQKAQMGPLSPRQVLNMDDGWDQEEQSVRRLAKAGIVITDRESNSSRFLKIGRSCIQGSIDGTVTIQNVKRLWEHKAKDTDSFLRLQNGGIRKFIGELTQMNAYMVGIGLSEGIYFVKHKDSNDYYEELVKLDKPFIDQVIEWADKIRLEGWKPEPQECKWCSQCYSDCFGLVLDMSSIGVVDNSVLEEKWLKGKSLVSVGESLIEEVETAVIGKKDKEGNIIEKGLIGDLDTLLIGSLKVKKITSTRTDIDKAQLLKEISPDTFLRVTKLKSIEYYSIRQT